MYALAIASRIPAPSTLPDLQTIFQLRGWHVTTVCIGIGAALRTGAYGAILFATLGGVVGFIICEICFGGPFPYGPSPSISNWFILCGGTWGAYFRPIDIFKQKELG